MTHIELYREGQGTWTFEPGATESVPTVPGDFRWRMVHTNGNVVAASTEGYADRRDMIHNLKFVLGARFDFAGSQLKRRNISRPLHWERFEVRDMTKEK